MTVLKFFKNVFFYAGLNKEQFYLAKSLFYVENRKMLMRMSIFLCAITFIMATLSFFVDSNVLQKNRITYIVSCVVEFFLAFIPYKFGLKKPSINLPLCYVYGSILYAFGIVIGTVNLTSAPTVTFVVLCATIPMMFYDHPIHCNFVTVLASSIYLAIGFHTKDRVAFITDVIDIVTFSIAGIFLNIFIMQSRARSLFLQLQAEHQKQEIKELNDSLVTKNKDLENALDKERRDNSIIGGLGSLFYAIYAIDLEKNSFYEVTTKSRIKNELVNAVDARTGMRFVTERMVANEDKTEVAVFNNYDTLKERLRGKRSISMVFEGANTGWSRALIVPIAYDEKGEVKAALYLARLINEEKKSQLEQENIRSIYESLNSALWNIEFDKLGEITLCYWSKAFKNMLGFANDSEFPAVLESWTNLIFEEDRDRVLQMFWSAVNDPTNSHTFDIEFRMQKKGGEYYWFHFAGRVTRRIDGSPISFIGVCMDINDQKKMEERIASQQLIMQNALVDAQRASNAKTTFLNKLSHDVRIPMNSITGFAELAKSSIDKPELLKEYLEKISVSAGYMQNVADGILDISRVETGVASINDAPNSIAEIVNGISAMVSNEMLERRIKYSTSVNVKNDAVLCDRTRLIQVALNMLTNAMCITKPREEIVLCVSQDFEPQNGVAAYAFHVRNPLRNSEIVIRLNLSVDSTVLANNLDNVASAPALALKGKRILLVEDDDLNCEIEKTVLVDAGCIVDTAANGVIAVEKIRNAELGDYDLILMDIQMPIMDGYEATRTIRRLRRSGISSLPIIAITAKASEEDKQRAFAAGMDGHIVKPIEIQKVVSIIASLAKF